MTRPCRACGQVKPLEEFHRDKRGKYGRRANCKACLLAYISQPEIRARRLAYQKTPAGKAATHKHYMSKHEHYLEQRRARRQTEKAKAESRAYFRTEAGKAVRARANARRRAASRDHATLTIQQWQAALEAFSNRCAYCRRNDRKLTQDHYVPMLRGGLAEMGNIVPSCQPCNSQKSHLDPRLWMSRNGLNWEQVETVLSRLQEDSSGIATISSVP